VIARVITCLVVVASSGCILDMDGFVWNARHCSVVSRDSDECANRKVCTPCDEPYDFTLFGIDAERVTQVLVPVGDGETNDAYFIQSNADKTIFYTHGNFGSLEHYMNRVALLAQTGANVFAVDYRGFGKSSSTSEPTEVQFMSDIRAARSALDSFDAGVVVPYGYSAGALGAVEVAVSGAPLCGMILESSWPSVQAFADDSTFIGVPQSFLTTGAWDNIAKMPNVSVPLLSMHGDADDFVREEHGRRVFGAAATPLDQKKFITVPGAGHGNFGDDVPTVMGASYLDEINAFLDACAP